MSRGRVCDMWRKSVTCGEKRHGERVWGENVAASGQKKNRQKWGVRHMCVETRRESDTLWEKYLYSCVCLNIPPSHLGASSEGAAAVPVLSPPLRQSAAVSWKPHPRIREPQPTHLTAPVGERWGEVDVHAPPYEWIDPLSLSVPQGEMGRGGCTRPPLRMMDRHPSLSVPQGEMGEVAQAPPPYEWWIDPRPVPRWVTVAQAPPPLQMGDGPPCHFGAEVSISWSHPISLGRDGKEKKTENGGSKLFVSFTFWS